MTERVQLRNILNKELEAKNQWIEVKIKPDLEKQHVNIDVLLLLSPQAVCINFHNEQRFDIGGIANRMFPVMGVLNDSLQVVQIIPRYELSDGRILIPDSVDDLLIPAGLKSIAFCDPSDEIDIGVKRAVLDIIFLKEHEKSLSFTLNVTPPKLVSN